MKSSTLSARLPEDLKAKVAALSKISGQSLSSITEDAWREYAGWRVPQIEDLREAIASVDRGEFATEAEVNACSLVMERSFDLKWSKRAIAKIGQILEYVSRDNPVAANQLAHEIRSKAEVLR